MGRNAGGGGRVTWYGAGGIPQGRLLVADKGSRVALRVGARRQSGVVTAVQSRPNSQGGDVYTVRLDNGGYALTGATNPSLRRSR